MGWCRVRRVAGSRLYTSDLIGNPPSLRVKIESPAFESPWLERYRKQPHELGVDDVNLLELEVWRWEPWFFKPCEEQSNARRKLDVDRDKVRRERKSKRVWYDCRPGGRLLDDARGNVPHNVNTSLARQPILM